MGTVIREFRTAANMSQYNLSEDICSVKYLYLIEKGLRTPSNVILIKMGEKLNVNFLEYYDYLDAENPIAVKKTMDIFSECRRTMDFKRLATYQNLDLTIDDFKHKPWKYELEFNDALSKYFILKETTEARDSILMAISDMPENYRYSTIHLRFLALLSLCYLEQDRMKSANFIIEQVMSELESKLDCGGYAQLYFMSAYIFMAVKLKSGQYNKVIEYSETVEKRQKEKNFYGLIHFNHLQRGCALSRMGYAQEAVREIQKGLMTILILDKQEDLDYLERVGVTSEILGFNAVNRTILSQIKQQSAGDVVDKNRSV